MAVDEDKLNELLGTFVTDVGGSFQAISAVIGDRLGLYRSLLAVMPGTPAEVAAEAGVGERYVREWLRAQAAGGYVTYDPATERFSLTEEQAFALASPDGMQIAAAFHIPVATGKNIERITEAVRTNGGFAWHEHDPELFEGTERFFRPGYVATWCPRGFPRSTGSRRSCGPARRSPTSAVGTVRRRCCLPSRTPDRRSLVSTTTARRSSRRASAWPTPASRAAHRSRRRVASDFPGTDYDLVAIFDALHDMPDPLGAAAHIRESLKPDGTFLLVEPFANDRVEDNFNPVGRLYYGASTVICVAHSMTEEPRAALGAQAGEARLTEILRDAGFTRIRRAAETPFNLILEARP